MTHNPYSVPRRFFGLATVGLIGLTIVSSLIPVVAPEVIPVLTQLDAALGLPLPVSFLVLAVCAAVVSSAAGIAGWLAEDRVELEREKAFQRATKRKSRKAVKRSRGRVEVATREPSMSGSWIMLGGQQLPA